MANRGSSHLKRRKNPSQARSEATVEAILVATEQLLQDRLLGEITTHDIAKRAGVSVGTLYQYFPSKQAITNGLLHRSHLAFYKRLVQLSEQLAEAPLGQVIQVVIQALIENLTISPGMMELMVFRRDEVVDSETLQERHALAATLIQSVLSGRKEPLLIKNIEFSSWLLVQIAQHTIRIAAKERPSSLQDGSFQWELTCIACRYLGLEPPEQGS